ncbi:hypothetical protein AMECASPLE_018854 [Ameca splendens]|uniref:Uncharacterized protein n=1 Tax=Ameca splendens TaxID=208324 RepID=A0ABV0XFY9_9TELE
MRPVQRIQQMLDWFQIWGICQPHYASQTIHVFYFFVWCIMLLSVSQVYNTRVPCNSHDVKEKVIIRTRPPSTALLSVLSVVDSSAVYLLCVHAATNAKNCISLCFLPPFCQSKR